jgi:hypothetical protein
VCRERARTPPLKGSTLLDASKDQGPCGSRGEGFLEGMIDNICMHCLQEGDWEDWDKCPDCAAKGHISPWQVSSCPACNANYFREMAELKARIEKRVRENL